MLKVEIHMEKLIQGREYRIRNSASGNPLLKKSVTYVTPEELIIPGGGVGRLETFFSDYDRDSVFVSKFILPKRSITKIEDNVLFSDLTFLLERKTHTDPKFIYDRTKINWLKEVEKIRSIK
jgi:hypothetical protein